MTHAHDTRTTHDTRTARDSATDPGPAVDVLLSSHDVADDGRISLHLLGPTRGVPAALWTHDPERLRRLLREHPGPARWQPREHLLRLRLRRAGADAGTTLVGVAVRAPGR